MTQIHSMNVTAERRWNKNISLPLWDVNKFYYTAQNCWKVVFVNNDFLFICLIKNAFSSYWLFIYSLWQKGDKYEELRGDFFFPNLFNFSQETGL